MRPAGERRPGRSAHPTASWTSRPLPQSALGLDVQRAGQVVKDQQLGVADEHARRSRALRLPPESRTPRGPTTVSSPWSRSATSCSITAAPIGSLDVHAVCRQAHQDVVTQRLAEQGRDLRACRRCAAARRMSPDRPHRFRSTGSLPAASARAQAARAAGRLARADRAR